MGCAAEAINAACVVLPDRCQCPPGQLNNVKLLYRLKRCNSLLTCFIRANNFYILIFRLICQTLNEYVSGYITGNRHYNTPTLSTSVYVNKMLTQVRTRRILIVTADVARLKHSGAIHTIHRSYHVQDIIRIACLCTPTHR